MKRHKPDGFLVMSRLCATCIYRPKSPLNLAKLEADVADRYGGFKGYRVCHHSPWKRVGCCRGFWNRHKWEFAAGQIAQRLGIVRYIAPEK